MDIQGNPTSQPSARKIIQFLTSFFSQYAPDELADMVRQHGLDAMPKRRYQEDGWTIDFFPIPKSARIRGKAGIRPIGTSMPEGEWLDCATPIRTAIVKKGGRYGKLDLPYVVAVNVLDEFADNIDIMEALFGTEEFTIAFGSSGVTGEPQFGRRPDGAWIGPSGARYTRVSAVLFAVRLSHWTLASCNPFIVHNPWAEMSCPSIFSRLNTWTAKENRMQIDNREDFSSILDLPKSWPHTE